MSYSQLIPAQRDFFRSGATLSYDFRLAQLRLLHKLLMQHEQQIITALYEDLRKPATEALITEIALIRDDLAFTQRHLQRWMRRQKVRTPFPQLWPGTSSIYYEPYGVALIIGPWNFPFLLTLQPLIGAIAAGNCALIKPSEMAPHSEAVIKHLINQHFPADYLHVITTTNADETQTLLNEKFDYLFFTGSERVGKIIMASAAQHLTPVTLELGGKSPCIVDESADIQQAAKQIIWGKMMNAGQVCVAPDYVYVHTSQKNALITAMTNVLHQFYGQQPEQSPSYGRIISSKHVTRLKQLLGNGTVLSGGNSDENTRYVSPTLIDNVSWQDPIMQEEIFGPLLPILSFNTLTEVITTLATRPKPLALYLFTRDKTHEAKILQQVAFGIGAINTCTLQMANYNLPFGGVGQSGMGRYHGKFSFETFSHCKGVYKKSHWFDLHLQYPPFTPLKRWVLKKLLRL